MLTLLTLSVYQDVFDQFVRSYFHYRHGDLTHSAVIVCPSQLKVPPVFAKVWEPEGGGLPAKLNAGMRSTIGDLFVVADDAQFTHYRTMDILDQIAYSDPKIGMVFPLIDGGIGDDTFRVGKGNPELADTLTAYGVAAFIKREALDAVGGWDEDYPWFGWEDIDFGLRVLQAGYRCVVTNKVVMKHGFGDMPCGTTVERKGGLRLEINQGVFENKWRGKLDWLTPIEPSNPTTAVLCRLQQGH